MTSQRGDSDQVSPEVLGEIAAALTELGTAAAAEQAVPHPPYCDRCEWDGMRLVSRCLLCARDARTLKGASR